MNIFKNPQSPCLLWLFLCERVAKAALFDEMVSEEFFSLVYHLHTLKTLLTFYTTRGFVWLISRWMEKEPTMLSCLKVLASLTRIERLLSLKMGSLMVYIHPSLVFLRPLLIVRSRTTKPSLHDMKSCWRLVLLSRMNRQGAW